METVTIIGPAEFIKTVTDLAERYSERREVTQAAYEASPPYDPVEVVGPRFVLGPKVQQPQLTISRSLTLRPTTRCSDRIA